ncbi:MAG: hypothetical protein ABSG41_26805 [Bryobacteraceae bacterium]|jgi:hypothetical protein
MATLLLLGSLFLSWCTFTRKRALARYGRSETIAAKIDAGLFDLCVSLADAPIFGANPPTFGGGSTVTSCTCTTYVNGVAASTYPIPVGTSCGGQICR